MPSRKKRHRTQPVAKKLRWINFMPEFKCACCRHAAFKVVFKMYL